MQSQLICHIGDEGMQAVRVFGGVHAIEHGLLMELSHYEVA